MRKVGGVMTASLTVPMVMGMRSAVREAALLEGALAKFDVVFGDMAEETRAWVDEFREGVPLSRREIVQTAAGIQDLLVPMGIAREEATGMTKDWLQLAAALSAFNDVPVDQALEAIRSGIAGQSRPLRQFGIDVRETALQQRALEMGLMRAGDEMSDQVRQQALLAQAYANSSDAVEGYEDQLGTTLMVQQELGATWKDTLALIGQDLQPMYTSLMGSVTDLLRTFQGLDDEQRQTIVRWGLMVAAAGPVIGILGQLLIWVSKLKVALKGLNLLTKTNLILGLAVAVGTLTQRVISANARIRDFKDALDDALNMDTVGSRDELELLHQQIQAVAEEMERLENRRSSGRIEQAQFDIEMEDLEGKMDSLWGKVDEVESKWKDNKSAIDDNTGSTDDLIDSTVKVIQELEKIKPIVENIQPVDEIIDPLEAANIRVLTEEYREFERALDAVLGFQLELGPVLEDVDEKSEEASRSGQKFADTMANALSQAALHGRSLSGVLNNLIKQFASRALVFGLRMLVTGGTGGAGGLLGSILGFADGGNPPTGKVSLVGERGPELIAPRSASTVIPNHALSQSKKSIVRVTSVNQIDKRTVWQAVNDYEVDL